jgi:hypothetical protein
MTSFKAGKSLKFFSAFILFICSAFWREVKSQQTESKAINKETITPKRKDTTNNKPVRITITCKSSNDPKNTPLYVVDGKVVDAAELQNTNPNDIQEINVLKDEKAWAKYGDKAKNGVVEIKIKKPSPYL